MEPYVLADGEGRSYEWHDVVFTMKALIVVVMGGVGNMLGCLVAGLALGLSEALVASYVDPGLTLAVNFALFLAVLLVKPAGLFGRATR